MRARLPRLFCALALLVCAGCRTLPFPEPELTGTYGRALKKWTRKTTLYDGLETHGFCRVVYLSPELIRAQAEEIAKMRAMLPDEAARTRDKMLADTAAPTFFAVFYTPEKSANDWDEKSSVWRIAVNIGIGQVPPSSIERREKPFDAEQRALYPILDDYSVAYVLHFPPPQAPPPDPAVKPAGAVEPFVPAEAELVIAGALGKMDFKWDLLALAKSDYKD